MKKQLLTCFALAIAITLNAQVTLVKEINDSGALSSSPTNLTIFNGKIYFSADDSSGSNSPGNADLGRELWISDGSDANIVKDINPGTSNSAPFNLFTFNGNFYFTANDGASELWTSDGTEVGTTKVDIMPAISGESPQRFVELGGLAYFTVGGQPGTGAETTNKLVEWDGTNDAVQVADVGTGYESILADMVAFDNKLFLYMNYSTDDATIGNELYNYDPATDTFTLIKDIEAGAGNSGISNFVVLGSELYFEALGALWKTDGTEGGTIAVPAASAATGVASLFAWNGNLYFEGDTGTSDDQLWKYDPIGDTLTNVSNITGGTNNDHDPSDFAVLDGFLYYAGEVADDTAQYLFRTDGITSTRVDANIFDIDDLAVLNAKLYFEGDNGTTGNELYSFDPTTLSVGSNAAEIINVFPNPASDYIMVSKNLINAPYSIFESTGKLVREGIIDSEKIQLNLTSGLYLVKIKTENSVVTKKIIVK